MTAVEWQNARRIAFARGAAMSRPAETVPLSAAEGRSLAADVIARIDIPHVATSAMDGWLVSGPGPWRLTAAARPDIGEAVPIVTGGVVGSGDLAVLRTERGRVEGGMLHPLGTVGTPSGTDVRPAAAEAPAGDVLLRAGTRLDPVHLAVAAAATLDAVTVLPRPEVLLVLTGGEVVASGVPVPGTVRDTLGPLFPGLIASVGGRVVGLERVGEAPATLRGMLHAGGAHDVIVVTGGTGGSPTDHLRATLADAGAEVVIPRVAVRPGGPVVLARLLDGPWVLGLPGNPLAAVAAFLTIGEPLLAGLAGAAPRADIVCRAASWVEGRDAVTLLVPALFGDDGALPARHRGSGMLRGLAESDVLLMVPPEGVAAGAQVSGVGLPWRGALHTRADGTMNA